MEKLRLIIDVNTPEGQLDMVLFQLLTMGLRRKELESIELEDVNLEDGTLYVLGKKGKDDKLQLTVNQLKALENYIADGRIKRLGRTPTGALFVTNRGAMQGQTMLNRLRKLQGQTGYSHLMNKRIGMSSIRR